MMTAATKLQGVEKKKRGKSEILARKKSEREREISDK